MKAYNGKLQQILQDQHDNKLSASRNLATKIDSVQKQLEKKIEDLEDQYVYSPDDLSTIRSNIEELFEEQSHLKRVGDRTVTQSGFLPFRTLSEHRLCYIAILPKYGLDNIRAPLSVKYVHSTFVK